MIRANEYHPIQTSVKTVSGRPYWLNRQNATRLSQVSRGIDRSAPLRPARPSQLIGSKYGLTSQFFDLCHLDDLTRDLGGTGIAAPRRRMQESAGIAAPDSSLGNPCDPVDASASQSLHTTVSDRALVLVRGSRARVERITPYAQCAVVHLAPLERHGTPPAVIVPFDRLTPVESARDRWCRTRTTALVGALAHDIVSSGVPAPLTRYASRLAVPAWQLSVARAFDEGVATRVLLSDAVGLGSSPRPEALKVPHAPNPGQPQCAVSNRAWRQGAHPYPTGSNNS